MPNAKAQVCHNARDKQKARLVPRRVVHSPQPIMHCTLLVPDLLLPRHSGAAPYRDLHLPALARLLARARCTAFEALSMEAWLCEAFEVARQHDWPVAPLTFAIDGCDPGQAYWLRCDPVHLRAHRGQLVLTDSSAFEPAPDEARALTTALSAHFAPDGLIFRAPHPARWYLGLDRVPALVTRALPDVAGKDIDRYLPTGDDRLRWHHVLNEIQMLLHAHPVNQAREALNQPAINSVWLWGGGVKPAVHGSHFARVWSDDALAQALATLSDIPSRALPENAATLLAMTSHEAENQLAVLPQLRDATGRGDLEHWRSTLQTLERDWFAPLHAALRLRRLSGLALVALNAAQCRRYDIGGGDLWKFWRTVRPLDHHG